MDVHLPEDHGASEGLEELLGGQMGSRRCGASKVPDGGLGNTAATVFAIISEDIIHGTATWHP